MYRKGMQGWLKHLDFILLDILCLHIAFVAAYAIRLGAANPYADYEYRNIAVIFTLVDLLMSVFANSFKGVLKRGFYREFAMTLRHVCLVAVTVSFYMFSVHISSTYSRILYYTLLIVYFALSFLTRLAWKRFLLSRPAGGKCSLFLIVSPDTAEETVRSIREQTRNAYRLIGMAVADGDLRGREIAGVAVCARLDDVTEYLRQRYVDEVLIALPNRESMPEGLVEDLVEMGIVVHERLNSLAPQEEQKKFVEKLGGSMVLTTSMNCATAGQAFVKRSMDILGGAVGCIITGILCIVIGPLIYLNSPGPIFFTQVRVGRNGKRFKMYKFRSMYLDAEERKKELLEKNQSDGYMFKMEDDPRIIGTKVLPDGTVKKGFGNFIRDWSLDEFPQFINVLKGDMSLVGTRPPTIDEWERYEPHHRARLSMRPGITGLWQVSGRSRITDFEDVVKLDKRYICGWSMGLDLKILFKTVAVVVGRDGAM